MFSLRYNPVGSNEWSVSIHDGDNTITHKITHDSEGFHIEGFTHVAPTLRLACKFLLTGDASNHRAIPLKFNNPIQADIKTALDLFERGASLICWMNREYANVRENNHV